MPIFMVISPKYEFIGFRRFSEVLSWVAGDLYTVAECNIGLRKRTYLAGLPCTVPTLSGTGDHLW